MHHHYHYDVKSEQIIYQESVKLIFKWIQQRAGLGLWSLGIFGMYLNMNLEIRNDTNKNQKNECENQHQSISKLC